MRAAAGDKPESRVEFRIRKMHSVHSYMLNLNDGVESGRLNRTAPKLGAMDLNLLVVFAAIMRDRSVTRAAERLCFSPPAMSHPLPSSPHVSNNEFIVRT